jgi:hypothetical protein
MLKQVQHDNIWLACDLLINPSFIHFPLISLRKSAVLLVGLGIVGIPV